MKDVVDELMKLFERTLGEDILIDREFAPALWSVRVDRSQLDQVLLNLIVNARQAMPDGGRLTLSAENVVVDEHDASTRADFVAGEYVMLTVTDTGEGMSNETLERAFEPFFSTRGQGGSGLGLATVFGAVRQNDGHISVESERDRGTTFKIYLPRFATAEVPSASQPPSRPASVTKRRIVLVVEDHPLLLRLTERILVEAGHTVLLAKDGPTALEVAAAFDGTIDLLLTDVVMPHMNGKQLASEFSAVRPNTRVLYLSGYAQDTIVHGGILEPGVALLPKPFSREALLAKIAAVVGDGGDAALETDPRPK